MMAKSTTAKQSTTRKKSVRKKKVKQVAVEVLLERAQLRSKASPTNKEAVRDYKQAVSASARAAKKLAAAELKTEKAVAAVKAAKSAGAKDKARQRVADGRAMLTAARVEVRNAKAGLQKAERLLRTLDILREKAHAKYQREYERAAKAAVRKAAKPVRRTRKKVTVKQ